MEPIRTVVEHYLETAIEVGLDFAVVLCFSLLIATLFPKVLTERKDTIGAIVSSALLIIGAIGGIGLWLIPTWRGDTPRENLNWTIFYTLSLIGFFLLFTYLISTAGRKKNHNNQKA